ncbi:MAG: glycoside hydrolase family 3 C-terminal domain-containing protein [Clostridia bacterium]|nr:glycoside hydrolase family 3 C-terminal domain-containing protein [Clostridia bacterium]
MTKEERKNRKVRIFNGKRIKRPNRFGFGVVTFLLVLVMLFNAVALSFSAYFGVIDNIVFAKAPTGDALDAVTADAKAITLQEAEEGIVLLTNKNETLPLQETKINVFGRGSYYSTFGGTGSGSGGTNHVSLYDGLAEAGFALNPDLIAFYAENAKANVSMGLVGTDFGLYENPASELSAALIDGAKAYSDVAVYVISRVGGEGDDLPLDTSAYYGGEAGRHYLELNAAEESMLALLEENFDTVVVVLNSTNAMELGFLEDENVGAALWTECFGSVGTIALGNLLSGKANPSGKTSDTFAYAVESNPTYYSFGGYDYTNASYANAGVAAGTGDAIAGADPYHYVKYNEGIYVGYRYYETAAADGFIDYDATVQFPFGYGLSYTDFTQTLDDVTFDGKTVTVKATVTNNGTTAGKEVVEVYYSAPYNKGGIEKSEVVLGGFAKTNELAPGASETVTITMQAEDMASYDYAGVKAQGGAYVLEAGEYDIRLQSDSHNVIDHKTITVEKDVIYNDANDGEREKDGVAATNLFDDVTNDGGVTYLSRADWAGTFPKERAASTEAASDKIVNALQNPVTVLEDPSPAKWTTKNSGLKLVDMKGVAYDDEKWERLLDQISKDEMSTLISTGGWQTAPVKSVGKARYLECDGPNGINNLMANLFAGIKGNMYTNQSTLAKTWNPDLAYQKGLVYGREAKVYGVAGIYGPAANIHRSPFSGRNYEYYSEDALLSGVMAERELTGIKEAGVYCYFKHFAVNDQETNRDHGGLVTWLNEQALREIYLRGFEIGVKGGSATGIMSSFNRIGTTPTAESSALLNTVLRSEWGFRGAVITDCVMACTTEDINRATLAGNDFQLSYGLISSLSNDITGTVSGQKAMRQATKNILYMAANSDAPALYSAHMTTFGTILLVIFLVLMLLFAQYYVRYFLRLSKWKKGEAVK